MNQGDRKGLVPLSERPKPRRIYICEKQWRMIKSYCAKEGLSVSEWMRQVIGITILFVILSVVLSLFVPIAIDKTQRAIISFDEYLDW